MKKIETHTIVISGNFDLEQLKESLKDTEIKAHTIAVGDLAVEKYYERINLENKKRGR